MDPSDLGGGNPTGWFTAGGIGPAWGLTWLRKFYFSTTASVMNDRVEKDNWRKGSQIKAHWYGNCSLLCYLDFKDRIARDDTLATAFKRFAAPGARPRVIHGHGWSCLDYSFQSNHFVSINELAEIADAKGYAYTVLYVQECVGARPVFGTLGIPLVPGEMGKEWVGGEFISYACPSGQNL